MCIVCCGSGNFYGYMYVSRGTVRINAAQVFRNFQKLPKSRSNKGTFQYAENANDIDIIFEKSKIMYILYKAKNNKLL